MAKMIQMRNVPDALHRQLKARAAKGKLNARTADRAVWMRMAA